MYDFLIVGSGLFGSVFAYEAKQRGHKVLVIDKRNHLGGNIHCEDIENIKVHKYGPHIFHTNDDKIWNYVNKFVKFNHFVYSPIAQYKDKLYNLPFNMNTFYQIWGVKTPVEAQEIINSQVQKYGIVEPKNLEEQAIKLVGIDIYEKLIKGYTEKQWGKKCDELPPFIIKRLPVRFNFDNNYFNDKYQGIPIGGYNLIIEKLLEGIDVKLGADFFDDRDYWKSISKKIVFTGSVDKYFDFKFGLLEYRSLKFETKVLDMPNYQGNAGVNYTDVDVPYTRIIEHKHFEFGSQKQTVITKEFSQVWNKNLEAYYPINDDTNTKRYHLYKNLMQGESNLIFGGRLAEYRYYDMHQVIASALKAVEKHL